MRGDSIRDLYAKTLALLGLGVLAGAGALVDYWPVGVTYPQANAALESPSIAHALTPGVLPQPAAHVPAVALLRQVPAPSMAHAVVALPVSSTLSSDVGQQVSLSLAQPISFAAASGPEVMPDAEPLVAVADYQTAALTIDEGMFSADSALAPVDHDSDGFITGAFKKAGSSIVKTGLKTGASIFDAARVIGGAVRKALPN